MGSGTERERGGVEAADAADAADAAIAAAARAVPATDRGGLPTRTFGPGAAVAPASAVHACGACGGRVRLVGETVPGERDRGDPWCGWYACRACGAGGVAVVGPGGRERCGDLVARHPGADPFDPDTPADDGAIRRGGLAAGGDRGRGGRGGTARWLSETSGDGSSRAGGGAAGWSWQTDDATDGGGATGGGDTDDTDGGGADSTTPAGGGTAGGTRGTDGGDAGVGRTPDGRPVRRPGVGAAAPADGDRDGPGRSPLRDAVAVAGGAYLGLLAGFAAETPAAAVGGVLAGAALGALGVAGVRRCGGD